jgi:hypothetical protein
MSLPPQALAVLWMLACQAGQVVPKADMALDLQQACTTRGTAMPSLDIYHDTVKRALQKEHWTITHDPFILQIGRQRLFADLGAERLISAERNQQKIAVEIKSFVGTSDVRDLEQALGQYMLYHLHSWPH